MFSKVFVLFAMIMIVNSQLITTRRIKSSVKNTIKLPKNVRQNLPMLNQCNCPMEQPRAKCPCGCTNPMECQGPIINTISCSERPCKCGSCKATGQCRCPDPPIIDTSYTFLPELPSCGQSINLPFPRVIEVPLDYPVSCGCQGPCQCRVPKIEPTCPVIQPNYSPIITESYLAPDLSTYVVAPINVPTFLIEPSGLPCGCPGSSCNCQSFNPVYEIFAPVRECPAPVQSCGCSRKCSCAQNVNPNSMSIIELPACPTQSPMCSCGLSSCGCSVPLPPVVGCPKYLRQVTIQPPFL